MVMLEVFFFGFGHDSGHRIQWGEVFGCQEMGRKKLRDFCLHSLWLMCKSNVAVCKQR